MVTIVSLFAGIGWGMIAIPTMIALFYNVVTSYCMYYLFASMTTELPWQSCNNTWNTLNCLTIDDARNVTNMTLPGTNISIADTRTPTEEYF